MSVGIKIVNPAFIIPRFSIIFVQIVMMAMDYMIVMVIMKTAPLESSKSTLFVNEPEIDQYNNMPANHVIITEFKIVKLAFGVLYKIRKTTSVTYLLAQIVMMAIYFNINNVTHVMMKIVKVV